MARRGLSKKSIISSWFLEYPANHPFIPAIKLKEKLIEIRHSQKQRKTEENRGILSEKGMPFFFMEVMEREFTF